MKKLAIVALAALALSACSRSAPENALDEGNFVDENVSVIPENVVVPEPVNVTNTVEPVAPPPAFSQDEQMRDDADASGMTARLPDEAPVSGNQMAPVEE